MEPIKEQQAIEEAAVELVVPVIVKKKRKKSRKIPKAEGNCGKTF